MQCQSSGLYSQLREIQKNLDEMDNPVLLIGSIKKYNDHVSIPYQYLIKDFFIRSLAGYENYRQYNLTNKNSSHLKCEMP